MKRYSAVVVLAGLALLAGCGGGGGDAQASKCVILDNGTKLCGQDAKAYCERFEQDNPDVQTSQACLAVGADVTSAGADAQSVQDAQQADAEAQARVQEKAASALKPAIKKILGSSNSYFYVHRTNNFVKVEGADGDREKLLGYCSAILRLDPTISSVNVSRGGDSTLFVTCQQKG